jgi:hypothetical protein
MGMFDELICEYPLPDGAVDRDVQEALFQTKSLDCTLDRYTITKDGRLILHKARYESVPEEERPYYGTPEWEESPFLRTAGSLKSVPVGDVAVPYHGYIRFYTYVGKHPDGELFEYLAKFTDGRLEEIRRVQAEEPDDMAEAGSRWGADQVWPYLQVVDLETDHGEETAVPITDTVTFAVTFDLADREEGFDDDIRFSIRDRGPREARLFAPDETSILLTVAQAERLATALLKAAQASRETR